MNFCQLFYFCRCILCVCLLGAQACSSSVNNDERKIPSRIHRKTQDLEKEMLSMAGTDSLLKTAINYLSSGSASHISYGGAKSARYIEVIDSHYLKPYDLRQLIVELKPVTFPKATLLYDADVLQENAFYAGIFNACKRYSSLPWKNQIPESIFLRYILPYRINDELLQSDTAFFEEFYNRFTKDTANNGFYKCRDMIAAATIVHGWLQNKKKGFDIKFGRESLKYPSLPLHTIDKLTAGSCKELSLVSVAYLRSLGIPATMDFAPAYLNLGTGHEWAVIPVADSSVIPFDIQNDSLGKFKHPDFKLSKVYRYEFTPVLNNHYSKYGYSKNLPDFINSPFLKDITYCYGQTYSVHFDQSVLLNNRLTAEEIKPVYLAVYGTSDWNIVGWGERSEKGISFTNVLPGGVYLPVIFEGEQRIAIGSPFILQEMGEVQLLKPDLAHIGNVNLTRKWPFAFQAPGYTKKMIGGSFELSMNAHFTHPVKMNVIKNDPLDTFNTAGNPYSKKRWKYIRYVGPVGSHSTIAEMEVYSGAGNQLKNYNIIGSDGSLWNDKRWTKDKVFDGDHLTYFSAANPDSSWVGLDFEHPVEISHVRFLARNTKNRIYKGLIYELLFWDESGAWHSLGLRRGDEHGVLKYHNVPQNALLLLKCKTEGVEERIFTYENNSQVWW